MTGEKRAREEIVSPVRKIGEPITTFYQRCKKSVFSRTSDGLKLRVIMQKIREGFDTFISACIANMKEDDFLKLTQSFYIPCCGDIPWLEAHPRKSEFIDQLEQMINNRFEVEVSLQIDLPNNGFLVTFDTSQMDL